MPTYDDVARDVLAQRHADGIRGIKSEESRYKLHIQPAPFTSKSIEEVEPKDIADWLRDMGQKHANDTRGVRLLERTTITRSQALVSVVFSEALSRGLIKSNPCAGVRLKRRDGASATKKKWDYLKLEEQDALLNSELIPLADRLTMAFAIYTGLRQGEQFNLELRDLHVDGDEPHVFVRFGSPGKPPKSGKTRVVPLFGKGLEAARAWLKLLPEVHPENPLGLVFPTTTGKRRPIGKPLGRVKIAREHICAWKRAVRLVGIERNIRWHDLRHTCATNLVTGVLGRRWTLEEIQPLMGHSSIVITQRYAHVGEDALKRAARETAEAAVAVATNEQDPPSSLVRLVVERVLATLRRTG